MKSVHAFLCCLALIVSADAQDRSGLSWFEVPPAADSANGTNQTWLRWSLDGIETRAESTQLVLASNATCSLYVNGQRLLKHTPVGDSGNFAALGFDVHSLLRDGRNTVAVAVQSDSKDGRVGLSVVKNVSNSATSITGNFRRAAELPPVGWQQTDFNDRDWAEIKPLTAPPEAAVSLTMPESFASPIVPAKQRTWPLRFEDGDHVVLVGATFIERAQLSEHLEATLAGTCGDRNVTFRNLGWSADTAFSDSRGIFDAPELGYLRLVEHIRAEEPTLALICYGQNEALTAGMTPDQFQQQLGRLLEELAASGIACVLISPHELFPARPPLPSPSRFNDRIELFSGAAASAANSRGLLYVDLFAGFQHQVMQIDHEVRSVKAVSTDEPAVETLADNGMHLTEHGYAIASVILRERLMAIPSQLTTIEIDPRRQRVLSATAQIQNVTWADDGQSATFEFRDSALSPLPTHFTLAGADGAAKGTLQMAMQPTDAASQYDQLRSLIQRKNELYFHRWRPQNITYLFGFRKHEQGNNAADIARFDPFIQELEQQIHELQTPRFQTVKATWKQ